MHTTNLGAVSNDDSAPHEVDAAFRAVFGQFMQARCDLIRAEREGVDDLTQCRLRRRSNLVAHDVQQLIDDIQDNRKTGG